jgi:hypothetical protein
MKERFIKLLDSVGYPYRSINSVDKKELVEIHRAIFNKTSSYYNSRTCSSCYVSMLNDLVIKYGLPKRVETSSNYDKRKAICLECPATKKQSGPIYTCGELGKSTKGRYPTCGCIINVKARFKMFNCPRGKWQ